MIQITHNIIWSKYKGSVFTSLHKIAKKNFIEIEFIQIAESENDRNNLCKVDLTYHKYPYKLLFKGVYSKIPKLLLIKTLFFQVWCSSSKMILLPGYHLSEFWIMLLAAKLRGKVIGVFCDSTAYDRPNYFIKGLLKKLFFNSCDVFFGYGKRSQEYLVAHGAPIKKIFYRCQAAALPHDYSKVDALTRRMLLDNSLTQRYLYVGTLTFGKNITDLLYAFQLVLFHNPVAQLVIVGTGLLDVELKELAAVLGVKEAVNFTGALDVNELREEYLKACCLVLPSSSEAWGLVVNEALSYGCPVVVSNRCGCIPELVIEGKSGFSFECGNIKDLSEKLIEIPNFFINNYLTASYCIELISTFSPLNAAQQILDGCQFALGSKE